MDTRSLPVRKLLLFVYDQAGAETASPVGEPARKRTGKEKRMDKIVERVKAEAKNGKLPCKRAFELAEELGVLPREVGSAANEAEVKIAACQLGCFK